MKMLSGALAAALILAVGSTGGCASKEDQWSGIGAYGNVWQLTGPSIAKSSEEAAHANDDQSSHGIGSFGWVWQLDAKGIEKSSQEASSSAAH